MQRIRRDGSLIHCGNSYKTKVKTEEVEEEEEDK